MESEKERKKAAGPNASFYLGVYSPFWDRFKTLAKRDGTSASKKITDFIVKYVNEHEPGNSQRPITAFVDGHPDQVAGIPLSARRSALVEELLKSAEARGGEISYLHVVKEIRETLNPPGARIPELAKTMCEDLKKLGVRILWPARGAF